MIFSWKNLKLKKGGLNENNLNKYYIQIVFRKAYENLTKNKLILIL